MNMNDQFCMQKLISKYNLNALKLFLFTDWTILDNWSWLISQILCSFVICLFLKLFLHIVEPVTIGLFVFLSFLILMSGLLDLVVVNPDVVVDLSNYIFHSLVFMVVCFRTVLGWNDVLLGFIWRFLSVLLNVFVTEDIN